jgi:hypothetical protein
VLLEKKPDTCQRAGPLLGTERARVPLALMMPLRPDLHGAMSASTQESRRDAQRSQGYRSIAGVSDANSYTV